MSIYPIDAGAPSAPPTHTALMAVDICAFGDRRDGDMQLHLRAKMYELLARAFAMTLLPWPETYREDRGDGALIILPPAVPAEILLDPLAHHLSALLRQSNRFASDTARLRMRVAVHAGDVHGDAHGVAGRAVVLLFRLLDCPKFKRLLATSGADVGSIVSEPLFQDATHRSGFVDAGTYQQINVRCKETNTRARVWLPPQCGSGH
jgi:hypothetical protein